MDDCKYCGAHLGPGEVCDCFPSRYALLNTENRRKMDVYIGGLLAEQKAPAGAANTDEGKGDDLVMEPVRIELTEEEKQQYRELFRPSDGQRRKETGTSKAALTLEAVKEQFCTADKMEALKKIRERLDDVLDIEQAAELTVKIGGQMEKELGAGGLTWTPWERIMWTVKEAFVMGCLDMAEKLMVAADMSYEALAGEQRGDELENPS